MNVGRPLLKRQRATVRAVLALGSNMGDRAATLAGAVDDIAGIPGVRVVAVSSWVETPALKLTGIDHDAPRYLNGIVLVDTELEPHDLLTAVNRIENAHGRVRTERWGDRTLDIDLIDAGGRIVHDDTLTLPHPRAHERAFVLVPWAQVDPGAHLEGRGPVRELLSAIEDDTTAYSTGGATA